MGMYNEEMITLRTKTTNFMPAFDPVLTKPNTCVPGHTEGLLMVVIN